MSYQFETKNGINICHTDYIESIGFESGVNTWLNRYQYKGHYREIENTRQLKALIREGQYCFPGGYAIIPWASDGGAICLDCIKENYTNILWSIKNEVDDGWRLIGLDIYYGVGDNGVVCCDHCGKDWENI